ncbi:MAG: glycosyltransferase family 2 protein [Marivita sp.]|uniref:glycosyltransferase family 2 protein n=1 Tax=Marivita sp. TaxID=2003365 RepID=UPI001B1C6A43|nr:glycosyltransferase family 2 protein [Marivita sp.]MBO6885312.1 glycosyltransferase family 2 protein [Marivita sp.]
MSVPAISVIIASRGRPDWLKRCLRAVSQLDYPRFETLIVACPAGAQVARGFDFARVIDFDIANISAARNAGVNAAWGEVVAFLDDDAVPEPTWLAHLAQGFGDPAVAQVGGTTLGRNGISVQHAASRVDAFGQSHTIASTGDAPVVLSPQDGRLPRLHGTNMALRRSVVVAQGGFDERFAFYLDESDLTYRISRDGGQTVFVPKAVVHHASGPSRFRATDRTPRDVFEIAASAAVFHGKHCPPQDQDTARAAFLTDRRAWLLRHMQSGSLPPDRAFMLIRDLAKGYDTGRTRAPIAPPDWQVQAPNRVPDRASEAQDHCLVVSRRDPKATYAKAKTLTDQGHRVTVIDYQRTTQYHRVCYTEQGFWLHTGGLYGRELRHEPLVRASNLQARLHETLNRIGGIRSKNPLILVD